MTLIRGHEEDKDDIENTEDDDLDLSAPETRAAGRWNSAGVPGERSKDFKKSIRRLGGMLGPMWVVLIVVAVVAIASAVLNVFGPRVLGHGTDIIVQGVRTGHGIEFGALHHVLFQAVELYAASSLLSTTVTCDPLTRKACAIPAPIRPPP